MGLFAEQNFFCPYCGSENFLSEEFGQQGGRLVQDCETCCRPITISARRHGDDLDLNIDRENG